jgi:hypothetical protein
MRKAVIPAYKGKPDFGDMDILFSNKGYDPFGIAALLDAVEIVRNGDVTSIGVKIREEVPYLDGNVFQIDLIKVPEESFDFALSYFSFNDMGNLLGRIGHRAGFKFGHLGLMYPVRNPENHTHLLAELTITSDFGEALTLLGYDADEYFAKAKEGFPSLTDIFEYVVSSPYVNKDIYLLDNRNAIARKRDSKRQTYMMFLEYLKTTTIPHNFDYTNKQGFRAAMLQKAFTLNPVFKHEYEAVLRKHKKTVEAHAKLNGGIITELTGLKGITLGHFITRLKEPFKTTEEYLEYVLQLEDVPAFIKQHYEHFLTNGFS